MEGTLIGERLAESRKRAGLAQVELAAALGDRYSQSVISDVERGRSSLLSDGLAKAAKELKVSTDYLLGLVDDPTPASEMAAILATGEARGQEPLYVIAEATEDYHPSDRRPVEVLEVASAAGGGTPVYDETPVGLLWFRNDWLNRHSIDPKQSHIISVRGDSMEPTLPDGCSILVDRERREPREDRIYVMRTEEGLVVKRLGLDEKGRWEMLSDNSNWEPVLLTYGSEIIGEVRWTARTF